MTTNDTQKSPKQIQVTGLVWYTEKDFDTTRAIFSDCERLPCTYKDWLQQAERCLKVMADRGQLAYRIYIDPNKFPEWCRARGLNIDANGRNVFANTEAYRMYMAGVREVGAANVDF